MRTYYGYMMTPVWPSSLDVVTTKKPSNMTGVLTCRAETISDAKEILDEHWDASCREAMSKA